MNKVIFAVVLALVALPAFAEDKSGGCGPGWWVTKSISFSGTTTRNTTNSSVMPYAMTSGTSGCAKHSIAMNDRDSYDYLEANKDLLALEVAQGAGEHAGAFAHTLGCDAGSVPALVTTLRTNYASVFIAPKNSFTMLGGIKEAMATNPDLAGCSAMGG